MNRKIWMAAAAAAALCAAPALAQVDATEVDPREMTQAADDLGEYDVQAQVGIGSFMGGGALGDSTGTGPMWGVKLAGPLAQSFGWEVGYEGSRTPITDELVEGDTGLWRHGVTSMAKVFAPVEGDLRPFAGAGIGASYVNVGEAAEGRYDNDLLAEIPLGVGVEYASDDNNLTAGLRGTYRVLVGQGITEPQGDTGGGSLLGASLTLGGRF